MPPPVRITNVRFTVAPPCDQTKGVVAWVQLVFDETLILDGITVRRDRSGRAYIAFPARSDACGRKHPFVRPVTEIVHKEIEALIVRAIPELMGTGMDKT